MKCPETARRLSLSLANAGLRPQELADLSGVSKASISQYINGSHAPSNISAGKMAMVLDVSPVWLMGLDDTMTRKIKKGSTMIPVLGRVAAGVPIDAIPDILGYEEIPEFLARTGEFFALKIRGDSMSPQICDGDIVIIKQQPDAESNEVVIATVNGSEAVCKRLRKYEGGLELISNNPGYKPMLFSAEEVDKKPVNIIGKVIELRRKF